MRTIFFIIAAYLSPLLWAQAPEWKSRETRDGLISVTYRVFHDMDEKGEKIQVVEYEAKTKAAVGLEECKSVMQDEAKHKIFMEGAETCRRIRDLPDGDWLSYYYLKLPWPMPEADVITRYKLVEDAEKNRFILTGTPAPDLYPLENVARMEHTHTKYTFTDLGNGMVEIIMYSRSIPLIKAPNWLVNVWFPDGPGDILRGIVSLANEE